MKLIIDYSVMMHSSLHGIFSDSYVKQNDLELPEYCLNLARNLFKLKAKFKPDETIICMDYSSNWRASFVKEYYHDRLVIYKDEQSMDKPMWYTVFDGVWYWIMFTPYTQGWSKGKCKKPDLKELNFSDSERFSKFTGVDVIALGDVWERGMSMIVPYYKGTRKYGDWKPQTPKDVWKSYSNEIAESMASVMDASILISDFAEGDDCVFKAVQDANTFDASEEVVVVSVDQDLYQLALIHPNLRYYNPVLREEIPLDNSDVRFKLICKIVGGDVSDNIKGVVINGAKMAEVKHNQAGDLKSGKSTVNYITKILDSLEDEAVDIVDLYRKAYGIIQEQCENDSFYKNMILVYLNNIPESIQADIEERIIKRKVVKNDATWQSLGLTKRERISIINEENQSE